MKDKLRRFLAALPRFGSRTRHASGKKRHTPRSAKASGKHAFRALARRLSPFAVRAMGHCGRCAWYGSAVVLALLAVFYTVVRLTLPMVAEKKPEIEAYLSQKTTHRIQIHTLDAHWNGLHPGLRIRGLQVYPLDSLQPAVELSEVRISIALLPLLWREFEINTLVVTHPRLALERLSDGRFRVSGFGPVAPTQGTGGEKFIGWLFQQNKLVIEEGELQWFDHQDTVAALHLSNVNLTLKNDGERHRLGASAAFPPGICGDCSIVADVKGNPLLGKNWYGEIYMKAQGLHVHELPKLIRETLPGKLHGAVNAQLWTEWEASRPKSVRGHLDIDGLRAMTPQLAQPVSVRQARADVSWEMRSDGWRLDLANFELGLSGPSWSVDRMRIVRRAKESTIQVKHLELDDISAFVESLKEQNNVMRVWAGLKPGGSVDQLKFLVTGPLFEPDGFSVEAEVDRLRTAPYGRFPGLQNVSGRLVADTDAGKFDLAARDFAIELPTVFRAPLRVETAAGRVTWQRHPDDWEVVGDGLHVSGDDGEGDGKLVMRIPRDAPSVPHMKLRVDFRNGRGENAAHYYPVKQLPPRTLAWMESSFLGGTITSGYLVYDGRIDNFPFDDGNGKFEVRGHVRDGTYEFLPGWMPIRAVEIDVVVNGRKVLVTGGGKIGNLDLVHVVAQTERDVASGKTSVRASGRGRGPISETLDILRDVDPRGKTLEWKSYLPPGLRAAGDGLLSMDLIVPTDRPEATQFSGEFQMSQGVLGFAGLGTVLQSIDGVTRFSEQGPEGGSLTARFLNGDSVIAIIRGAEREFSMVAHGVIPATGLAPLGNFDIAEHVSGEIDWSARWRFNQGKRDLYAEFDLQKIKTRLPPPLDRSEGVLDEKLVIQTETDSAGAHVLAVKAGTQVAGKLVFETGRDTWRFLRGRIGFGVSTVDAPDGDGLHLMARVGALDGDKWLALARGEGSGLPKVITRVSAYFQSLDLLDRRFEQFAFDFDRRGREWHGNLQSPVVSGRIRYEPGSPAGRISLDLEKLHWPQSHRRGADVEVDPRTLPDLTLRVQSLQVREHPLGEFSVKAEHMPWGWNISKIGLTRPEMQLAADGKWHYRSGKHASEFALEFNSQDLGETMAAWGIPDQVAGGKVSVKSQLSWNGSPASPSYAGLNGRVEVSARKGRFVQVKQGAGRLFGIFDISSIFRMVVLDFSALLGKGYPYDKIGGTISIEQGNVYTRDLSVRGPTATLDINGRVGLAQEDFDLVLSVAPKLSGSVTSASWLILGPTTAVIVAALQKLFKKQIAAGTRVLYEVKGPWEKPTVTRVIKEEERSPESKESN